MNSFLLFSNEIRPVLQARHKDKTNAQISKLVGEEWHKLDADKKKTFTERAEKIKMEFSRQHPDFVYTKRRRRKSQYVREISSNPYAHYSIPNNYTYGMHMSEFGMLQDDMMSYDDINGGMIGYPFPYPGGSYPRHHLSSPFQVHSRNVSFYSNQQQAQSSQQFSENQGPLFEATAPSQSELAPCSKAKEEVTKPKIDMTKEE